MLKSVPLRLPAELLSEVRGRVGARGLNKLVVGLLEGWLAGGAATVRVDGRAEPIVPVVIKTLEVRPLMATDLPVHGIPEGAVCAYQTRTGICGQPAKFARGNRYFCPEH